MKHFEFDLLEIYYLNSILEFQVWASNLQKNLLILRGKLSFREVVYDFNKTCLLGLSFLEIFYINLELFPRKHQ